MTGPTEQSSPPAAAQMLLSVVIPAYNESANIEETVRRLASELREAAIPFELIVVDDNSRDNTASRTHRLAEEYPETRLVGRTPPGGFGRAIRSGLEAARGDVIVPFMADLSDSPGDVVRYYRKIVDEGYDCVFGSRWIRGGEVRDFPKVKLVANRIVNRSLQWLFWTRHDDLTNAFKAYRAEVIRSIQPLRACHFNITIEMSLSALIRRYRIAVIPISWHGRRWGQSNLKLRQMGRRYLATLLKIWFERLLILDDLLEEARPGDSGMDPSVRAGDKDAHPGRGDRRSTPGGPVAAESRG